jgi:hypothetical protein
MPAGLIRSGGLTVPSPAPCAEFRVRFRRLLYRDLARRESGRQCGNYLHVGLGRYLYNFAEMWVPLNEYRQPVEFPKLPNWALPKGSVPAKSHPASGSRPPAAQRGPIDQKTTVKIEGFRRILGDPIYGEILWRVAHARQANAIPNAQLQANVAEAMERASRGVSKAHSLADQIGETSFIAILDRLRIESMTAIPRLECLKTLVAELEQEAARTAA